MKLSEIFGKTLSFYDSWNGDYKTIQVDAIIKDENDIIFSGKGYWGNFQKAYIPIDEVDELMEKGKLILHSIIDHCDVTKEIKFI